MKIEIDGKSIYECSKEELKAFQEELKLAFNLIRQREVLQFHPQQKVSFEHKGVVVTGTVIKVNQKSVSVKEDNSHRSWNVSPGFLTIVEHECVQ